MIAPSDLNRKFRRGNTGLRDDGMVGKEIQVREMLRIDMNNMCCCCCMCISGRFLRPGALPCGHVPVYRKQFLLMPENAPGSKRFRVFLFDGRNIDPDRTCKQNFSENTEPSTRWNTMSIHVEKGDIRGIIGYSGAGKSTLIRLVNGLKQQTAENTVCERSSHRESRSSEH